MFTVGNGTDQTMVIEILEVLLLVQSVALVVQSERKSVKIVNALCAAFWLFCIVYNAITCGLF